MKDIDQFLRETKPQVKEDPTFILETRRRLNQVGKCFSISSSS